MKKLFFAAFALLAICSCNNEDPIPVPEYVVANFEGTQWSTLIDNPQYGGALLYSPDEYKWTDGTTALSSSCRKEDWTIYGPQYGWGWGNGIAISNYIDSDLSHGDSKHQLSVPVSNGSKNFAVVWDNDSKLTFADGKARVIRAMEVCLTTYSLANVMSSHGEGYKFFVTATGTLADGSTKTKEIVLAEGAEKVMDKWTVVSLAELGAVKEVSFTFDGTDASPWGGINTPKYFAFDNVIIEK